MRERGLLKRGFRHRPRAVWVGEFSTGEVGSFQPALTRLLALFRFIGLREKRRQRSTRQHEHDPPEAHVPSQRNTSILNRCGLDSLVTGLDATYGR
jgi:hypothetical protein